LSGFFGQMHTALLNLDAAPASLSAARRFS
jgi:hypothetical protein